MSDFKAILSGTLNQSPDPAGGAYSTPPDHLAGLRGPTSKGKEEEGGDKTPPLYAP